MSRFTLFTATVLSFVSCSIIETNPYDVKIPAKYAGTNDKNIALIEQRTQNKSSLKFALIGDTQRHYDDTEDFVKSINTRDDIDFVIHGGDISDFGLPKEYMWIHDILSKLTMPYVAVIGNHDFLGTGRYTYSKIYGDINFHFTAAQIHFVCVNTNVLESKDTDTVPDFEYIDKQVNFTNSEDAAKSTIVVMHSPPFDIQFSNKEQCDRFQQSIKKMREMKFCLHAHTHKHTINDYFDDGVTYYSTSSIESRSYLLFTLSDNTYSYEVVKF